MRVVSRSNVDDAGSGGGELNLSGVGAAIARSKKFIIASTLVCLGASVVFVSLAKPRYTAEAKALIENQENYFTRPDRATPDQGVTAPDAEAVTSQVQLVTSRDLARDAIKALNLRGNPEFDPAAGSPGLLRGLLSLIGGDAKATVAEDRVYEAYFDHLYVFPIVKSRVLQIEFSSQDPALAAKAANTIAELYIGVQSGAKRENARVVASSLAALNADLRTRVAEAERKAEEFRASNGLVLGANNISMSGQQLADMNSQLTIARTAQADAQAKSRLIRDMLRQGRLGEVPDVANNELIRRLSEQRTTLSAQIASEGRTLLPGHPRLKELNAQLSEIDGSIRATADKAARTLENDAKLAGSRVDNLRAALEQQKKTVGGASVDEARARELDREARLLKDQLEASTAKYQEALARQSAESTPSDARIISRAIEPSVPSFPKKAPIIVFATVAGLLLSVGTVLAAELLSGRAYLQPADDETAARAKSPGALAAEDDEDGDFEEEDRKASAAVDRKPFREGRARTAPRLDPPRRSEEAEEAPNPAGFPSSAGAPARGSRVNLSSFVAPSAAPARPAESPLARIAGEMSGPGRWGPCLRILVTGADRATDSASVAVALGRLLCADRRAILVEIGGDGQAAGQGPAGLSELLGGRAGFDEVIHRDRGSPLHLMPSGGGRASATEGLDVVVDALSRTYDNVILLAPPVGEGADVFVLAPEVDYTLLVHRLGGGEDARREAVAELRRAGADRVFEVADDAPVQRNWSAA